MGIGEEDKDRDRVILDANDTSSKPEKKISCC